jgi:2-polyprenyl-6-methoxyphenol hydroxylase-like FAD-dependent oxidoreductase
MNNTRTALIIGAGIAGPATALALHKADIAPVIYEAHPSGADGVGVFLTLASNGIDALRVLGADEPALDAGFPTPSITLRSGSGKYLGKTPTGHALPDGTVSQTIKRAELYHVLREQVQARGIEIEYGKRLIAAEGTDEGVRASFSDGSVAVADVLVGCDGIGSTARKLIDARAPDPRYEGILTTGGYARGVRVDSEPGSYEMIFGKGAFFGYAQAPEGEVWWFANVPSREEPSRGELEAIGGEERRRRLFELFSEDAGPACAVIDATAEIMPLSPIYTVPHLPSWHRGRMIVIGDAAHAPSPTSGQGASLSIEDAAMLAICLRDHSDPETAFARFDAARRPRVERIIKWAARVNSSKAPGPVGRVIRDAMLPPILRLTANSKAHRESFEYHIDWNSGLVPAGSQGLA